MHGETYIYEHKYIDFDIYIITASLTHGRKKTMIWPTLLGNAMNVSLLWLITRVIYSVIYCVGVYWHLALHTAFDATRGMDKIERGKCICFNVWHTGYIAWLGSLVGTQCFVKVIACLTTTSINSCCIKCLPLRHSFDWHDFSTLNVSVSTLGISSYIAIKVIDSNGTSMKVLHP